MLLARIIENNKIEVYFRSGKDNLRLTLPRRVRKGIRIGIRIGPGRVIAPSGG